MFTFSSVAFQSSGDISFFNSCANSRDYTTLTSSVQYGFYLVDMIYLSYVDGFSLVLRKTSFVPSTSVSIAVFVQVQLCWMWSLSAPHG